MIKRTCTTRDIADWLGIKRQQINYYIKQGYLTAHKVGKSYIIDYEDYINFRDRYFDDKFNDKQRGVKTLNKKSLEILKDVIKDIEDESIDLSTFLKKNPNIHLLPHAKIYIKYKRNMCILNEFKERKKNETKKYIINKIAKKYNLSSYRVEEILEEMEYNLE